MLKDSPLWTRGNQSLTVKRIVTLWDRHLLPGQYATIDLVLNPAFNDLLVRMRQPGNNRPYGHNFISVFFTFFVTPETAAKVIRGADVSEIVHDLLESISAHVDEPSLPSPVVPQVPRVDGKNEGTHVVTVQIRHPEFHLAEPQALNGMIRYIECVKSGLKLMAGGIDHRSVIAITNGRHEASQYEMFGYRLVREQDGDNGPTDKEARYLFCLAKDPETARALGVPSNIDVTVHNGPLGQFAANASFAFAPQPQPRANLTPYEQRVSFLSAIGFSDLDSARVLARHGFGPQMRGEQSNSWESLTESVRKARQRAFLKLHESDYPIVVKRRENGQPQLDAERFRQVVRANLHEVRSVVCPWYPWPDDLDGFPE